MRLSSCCCLGCFRNFKNFPGFHGENVPLVFPPSDFSPEATGVEISPARGFPFENGYGYHISRVNRCQKLILTFSKWNILQNLYFLRWFSKNYLKFNKYNVCFKISKASLPILYYKLIIHCKTLFVLYIQNIQLNFSYCEILKSKSLQIEGIFRWQMSLKEENKGKYCKFNYCKFYVQDLNLKIIVYSKFCLLLNVLSYILKFLFFFQ